MQINDKNSYLESLINNTGKKLDERTIRKLGEAQFNFIVKLFKKISLSKKESHQFFLSRGESVIKKRNLNFIREKLLVKDPSEIVKKIPHHVQLVKAERSDIIQLHKYLNLKNQYANLKSQIEKQKQEAPNNIHWIDHFGSEALSDDPFTLETISRLNDLYLENENWLTHEDFAKAIGENLDRLNPTGDTKNPSKFDLVANTLRFIAKEPAKKNLFDAFFNLEETSVNATLNFYIQNPTLLKTFLSSIPKDAKPEDLSKPLVNLKEWHKFLSLKAKDGKVPADEAHAFISGLTTHLFDSNPSISSSKASDVKKLFGFYLDIMRAEKLKPDILAQALNKFMETHKFHDGVDALGTSYSTFVNNAAENKLLAIYKTIEHEEAQKPKNIETPLVGLEKTLSTDPFSVAKKILPNFIAQIAGDPKVAKELEEVLNLIGPFANELILSDDFKANLQNNQGELNNKLDTFKTILGYIDTADIKALIKLMKEIAKGSLSKGVGQDLVNIFKDAKKLHLEGKSDNFSVFQELILVDLPSLSLKTSILNFFRINTNSLVSKGGSALNTGFGKWLGETIGGSVVKGKINKLIDTSSLSDSQKEYWKNNSQLMEGINKLVSIVVPILPKIAKAHDINFYAQALKNINDLIQSPEPFDEKKLREELSKIVNHFLDKDLSQYEGAVLDILGKIDEIG